MKCEVVNKIAEVRPNVLDIILNKQVNLIINTPWAKRDAIKDDKYEVSESRTEKYTFRYGRATSIALCANAKGE